MSTAAAVTSVLEVADMLLAVLLHLPGVDIDTGFGLAFLTGRVAKQLEEVVAVEVEAAPLDNRPPK
ncbi:hypothetical protein RRF57_000763 [Xylaria bambusicola]|uniref:Carrier domain-containing protein n=1 Tax=Xylaria bambusicola TaxID=326684 RepID=A0AAN7UCS0_9PEZI